MKWLKESAAAWPEKKFLGELTFGEAFSRVEEIAYRYALLGDRQVAFAPRNREEDALTLFSLLALGKEVLLLNPKLPETEIVSQMRKLHIYTRIFAGTPGLAMKGPAPVDWAPADDKVAVLMNTSGTTGDVKTIPITWGMISSHVAASAEALGVEENDCWLDELPIFHVSGLSILMRSLYNVTRVVFRDVDGSANMVSWVPTQLQEKLESLNPGKFRVILLGGTSLPERLIVRSFERGLRVYKTYGMTETFSQSVTFSIQDFPEKLESVGKPLPGVEVSFAEDREILLSSPMLMTGYLGREPLPGHEFATGDIGHLDADGFLYVEGRKSDLMISGGENIFPAEIENVAYQFAGVREAAVVAREDAKWGQVPVLYVVGDVDEEALLSFLREKLVVFKVPKIVVKLDGLPKNATGKILKKELK
ncbi:MAG: o-succinylbenzoate--CoA ligase [Streptococcaceae bacterium]|jgi:O-succinylbenzoic acid--CoA ligase|nr:o-succinylbenzoate--CoA ligase [Streptococcaceae bacterium]